MDERLEMRMRDIEQSLGRMEEKLDTALKSLYDHEIRLRSLECKPGKRWDALVGQIIAVCAAGLVGYFLAK